jgi:hypothetical protein
MNEKSRADAIFCRAMDAMLAQEVVDAKDKKNEKK